jgi:hypothetical protein
VDRREASGQEVLTSDADLAGAAEWFNQQRVRVDYGNSDGIDRGEFNSRVGDACADAELAPSVFSMNESTRESEGISSAQGLARLLVEENPRPSTIGADVTNGIVGVDVHAAPDGTLYVTQFAC